MKNQDSTIKNPMHIVINPKMLDKIWQMGGYRERQILLDLVAVEQVQNDESYNVIKLTDSQGNSFDYEVNSNRITG